jgi:hypothetical protein
MTIHLMKGKMILKILSVTGAFLLVLVLMIILVIEPLIKKKIETSLTEFDRDLKIEIGKIHLSLIEACFKLENITLSSKPEHNGDKDIRGEIGLLKFKRINIIKALFKKDIDIREVTVSNSRISVKFPFKHDTIPVIVLHLNVKIDTIIVDNADIAIRNTSNAQSFSVKEGIVKVYNLQVHELDSLSVRIAKEFDFEAKELFSVSADSMYSFTAMRVIYSETSKSLGIDRFSIHPNYKDYEFTSRYKFQKSRIEAGFSNIQVNNFPLRGYLDSGNLKSSSVEIGNMDMDVFRDKRREFNHAGKPAFQDMIYNYNGIINIDTIRLLNGNIKYTEHAEHANDAGSISFKKINARIYKISNDTIYKRENDSLRLICEALIMGKSKLTISLRGKIYDNQNAFLLNGSLSGMDADELNPILEKNAYIFASGKIDGMNFYFMANNSKSTGKMTLLYHGLDIAVKNKRTDDTTAFKERFISLFANRKILDSNPRRNEKAREGVINFERDPERFLFNYCFKSILSGIKSSIVKDPQ